MENQSGPEQAGETEFKSAQALSKELDEALAYDVNVTVTESKFKLSTGEEMSLLEAHPEYPQDIETVVTGGFLETPHSLEHFAEGLAKYGERDTWVEAQPRKGKHERTSEMSEAEYAGTYIDRAERLVQTATEKDMKRMDMLGHSQGCIDAVVAALIAERSNPGLVRTLLLFNPAGSLEVDPGADHGAIKAAQKGVKGLLGDAKEAIKHPTKLRDVVRSVKEAASYVAPNPLQTAAEVRALLQTDIRAGLRELRAAGVVIAIVAGVDDEIFPMDQMQQSITSEEVDGFYSVQGGHNEIWMDADRQGRIAAGILGKMAGLSEKREREALTAKKDYGLAA